MSSVIMSWTLCQEKNTLKNISRIKLIKLEYRLQIRQKYQINIKVPDMDNYIVAA